jgi:hypothetical protein
MVCVGCVFGWWVEVEAVLVPEIVQEAIPVSLEVILLLAEQVVRLLLQLEVEEQTQICMVIRLAEVQRQYRELV